MSLLDPTPMSLISQSLTTVPHTGGLNSRYLFITLLEVGDVTWFMDSVFLLSLHVGHGTQLSGILDMELMPPQGFPW